MRTPYANDIREGQPSLARPPALLVGLAEAETAEALLGDAAGRAAAEGRPLLVAVLREPPQWTMDVAVAIVSARRRLADVQAMIELAVGVCARRGAELRDVVVLQRPWRPTQAGRHRAARRLLRGLARRARAELHPSLPRGEVIAATVQPGGRR